MSETSPAQIAELHLEIRIDASPEKAWRALTEEIHAWWPQDFYGGGEPGNRSFHLEAWPGGRMYESWKGQDGLLWGTIASIEEGKKLQITGTTFPEWGGPTLWFGTWKLEEDGDGCLLHFSESTLGKLEASNLQEKESGWKFLFAGALKAFVEGRPAPAWQ